MGSTDSQAMMVSSTRQQLELLGLDECLRRAEAEGATTAERLRLRDRYETAHGIMSALPEADELAFLHSGLCQTYLPHSRPASNRAIWRRSAGDLTLEPLAKLWRRSARFVASGGS